MLGMASAGKCAAFSHPLHGGHPLSIMDPLFLSLDLAYNSSLCHTSDILENGMS